MNSRGKSIIYAMIASNNSERFFSNLQQIRVYGRRWRPGCRHKPQIIWSATDSGLPVFRDPRRSEQVLRTFTQYFFFLFVSCFRDTIRGTRTFKIMMAFQKFLSSMKFCCRVHVGYTKFLSLNSGQQKNIRIRETGRLFPYQARTPPALY